MKKSIVLTVLTCGAMLLATANLCAQTNPSSYPNNLKLGDKFHYDTVDRSTNTAEKPILLTKGAKLPFYVAPTLVLKAATLPTTIQELLTLNWDKDAPTQFKTNFKWILQKTYGNPTQSPITLTAEANPAMCVVELNGNIDSTYTLEVQEQLGGGLFEGCEGSSTKFHIKLTGEPTAWIDVNSIAADGISNQDLSPIHQPTVNNISLNKGNTIDLTSWPKGPWLFPSNAKVALIRSCNPDKINEKEWKFTVQAEEVGVTDKAFGYSVLSTYHNTQQNSNPLSTTRNSGDKDNVWPRDSTPAQGAAFWYWAPATNKITIKKNTLNVAADKPVVVFLGSPSFMRETKVDEVGLTTPTTMKSFPDEDWMSKAKTSLSGVLEQEYKTETGGTAKDDTGVPEFFRGGKLFSFNKGNVEGRVQAIIFVIDEAPKTGPIYHIPVTLFK